MHVYNLYRATACELKHYVTVPCDVYLSRMFYNQVDHASKMKSCFVWIAYRFVKVAESLRELDLLYFRFLTQVFSVLMVYQ